MLAELGVILSGRLRLLVGPGLVRLAYCIWSVEDVAPPASTPSETISVVLSRLSRGTHTANAGEASYASQVTPVLGLSTKDEKVANQSAAIDKRLALVLAVK
jgi:hypothetical protein